MEDTNEMAVRQKVPLDQMSVDTNFFLKKKKKIVCGLIMKSAS